MIAGCSVPSISGLSMFLALKALIANVGIKCAGAFSSNFTTYELPQILA